MPPRKDPGDALTSRGVTEPRGFDMPEGICAVDGCERTVRSLYATWCNTHYFRVRRSGAPGAPEIAVKGGPKPLCSSTDCDRVAYAHGMCSKHDRRVRLHGDPDYVTPTTGQFNNCYRGDNIGIVAAHERVTSQRGTAKQHPCKDCGQPAYHWAYQHTDPDEKIAPLGRGPYSVHPEHYEPMCVPCHKRFDLDYIASRKVAV